MRLKVLTLLAIVAVVSAAIPPGCVVSLTQTDALPLSTAPDTHISLPLSDQVRCQ